MAQRCVGAKRRDCTATSRHRECRSWVNRDSCTAAKTEHLFGMTILAQITSDDVLDRPMNGSVGGDGVFQHGSRRRSAPQVSDLIDTDGVTRARLFTRKTKIRVVGHRPRRIDTQTRLPSSRNRIRQLAFLSCTRRVATGRNGEDGRSLFCRFLTATATHWYAWRLTCSWRVHATYPSHASSQRVRAASASAIG